MNILAPASEAARTVSEITWLLFGGAALIFVGVMLLALVGWRSGPRRLRPALWIGGGGVAFPALVLASLLVWSESRVGDLILGDAGESAVIGITGHMWWWEIRYQDPDGGRTVTTANELRIPAGRPVVIGVSSADVIHSFWVPELGGKIDMIPGRTLQMRLSADLPGVYRGQCAEYCGEQHARMALHVVAMPAEEYEAWLSRQAEPAGGPAVTLAADTPAADTPAADTPAADTPAADTPAADTSPASAPATGAPAAGHPEAAKLRRGRQAFTDLRCGICHTVRGLEPAGALGPDLTHVGSRLHIAAGTLPAGRESLRDWIADPQSFKPGARMPSYGHVDPETLDSLAAWLEQLR